MWVLPRKIKNRETRPSVDLYGTLRNYLLGWMINIFTNLRPFWSKNLPVKMVIEKKQSGLKVAWCSLYRSDDIIMNKGQAARKLMGRNLWIANHILIWMSGVEALLNKQLERSLIAVEYVEDSKIFPRNAAKAELKLRKTVRRCLLSTRWSPFGPSLFAPKRPRLNHRVFSWTIASLAGLLRPQFNCSVSVGP